MPEITDGGRTWTIRLKTGIRFADDPAFSGKPRELVADDYVYSLKRWLDPNAASGGGEPALTDLDRRRARRRRRGAASRARKFDYDAPIEGLRALDRTRCASGSTAVDYTLLERLASLPAIAVAREVIEARRRRRDDASRWAPGRTG